MLDAREVELAVFFFFFLPLMAAAFLAASETGVQPACGVVGDLATEGSSSKDSILPGTFRKLVMVRESSWSSVLNSSIVELIQRNCS